MSATNQLLIVPPSQRTPSTSIPEIRLLLVCQAEGLQSRYSELSTEDSGLTAQGWEQTNLLAAWIATHEKVDVLVSAPQLRSRLTAQRIGQVVGKTVAVNRDLPYHARVGNSSSTNSDRHYLLWPLHQQEQFTEKEKYDRFRQTLVEAVQKLIQEHWGKTLLLVLDGNAIATLLVTFCQGSNIAFSVNHTSIAEVNWHAGEWSIVYTNRLEHNLAPALAVPTTTTAVADAAVDSKDADL
ncbi:MAG: histidine phosphatase family protein, partial [Caldilineaceae bacterium]|nr:histidine phosphatase family protein [Caldilineaceae bacterium]